MSLKFGTSGLRGLVTELTDETVARYAAAFATHLGHRGEVLIGRDLRPSSPRIAAAVAAGLGGAGATAVDCGEVPTPALALEGARRALPAIMVTGSHIPADRNGLKFYSATGEIGKEDEPGILAAFAAASGTGRDGPARRDDGVAARYRDRYLDAFPGRPLAGLAIGVYQHSSVARDLLVDVLAGLGAEVTPLGRSDTFVPVDTEAVGPDAAHRLAAWAAGLDAIVSTDGDADRPMVADAAGHIVPGDILGPITARELGAGVIVTPVSSNTLVDLMPGFARVIRTRIGSPYVIAGMTRHAAERAVGYEANGGFLLGYDVPGGPSRLMTRDCLLPIVVPLLACARQGLPLAGLVAQLPPRRTHSDRIQGVAPDISATFLAGLQADPAARSTLLAGLGPETGLDLTDGLRMTLASGEIVHLRASGNAPEFRCYAEADDTTRARSIVETTLARIRDWVDENSAQTSTTAR